MKYILMALLLASTSQGLEACQKCVDAINSRIYRYDSQISQLEAKGVSKNDRLYSYLLGARDSLCFCKEQYVIHHVETSK